MIALADPTPFDPVAIPVTWQRLHVDNAVAGPSELHCRRCKGWMLPLVPCSSHEDVIAQMESFPAQGLVIGNVPPNQAPKGVSLWACMTCSRGVSVTW